MISLDLKKIDACSVDLNVFLVDDPAQVYLIYVQNDALQHFGIQQNDILIINSAIFPEENQLILVEKNGGHEVHQYMKSSDVSPKGVVVCVIRRLLK